MEAESFNKLHNGVAISSAQPLRSTTMAKTKLNFPVKIWSVFPKVLVVLLLLLFLGSGDRLSQCEEICKIEELPLIKNSQKQRFVQNLELSLALKAAHVRDGSRAALLLPTRSAGAGPFSGAPFPQLTLPRAPESTLSLFPRFPTLPCPKVHLSHAPSQRIKSSESSKAPKNSCDRATWFIPRMVPPEESSLDQTLAPPLQDIAAVSICC